jgi:hypothetical protein
VKQDLYKFPLHVILHPFDGFWDMKYEGKGKLRVALLILFLLVLVMIFQRQYAGFLVNYNDPMTMNSLNEFKYVLLPYILWCVSNWAVSTLMEGEGKFKDIVMATSYSLVPIILIFLPATVISNFMALEETSFYWLSLSIALLWSLYLLFVGTMTVHQYSAAKTIVTMFLTVIAMLIIIFLGLLVFSLIQQVVEFMYRVYQEIVYRT